MSLNAHSPIPLYRQLADRLLSDIDAGVHAVAARIPSEHELAQRFDIGRPTVRQATDLLVRRGRLERRRGSGTYVLPPAQSIDVFSLAGTSAALHKSDLNARLELVNTPLKEPARVQGGAPGQLDNHHAEVTDYSPETARTETDRLRVERIATVDGTPVLFETLWFEAELFPGLESRDLADQSLSALVRDDYFLEPTSADQAFSVVSASDEQATQLDLPEGTPLLRVYRQLHFAEHRGALHAEMICLTDRFAFSQTLFPAHADTERAGVTNHSMQKSAPKNTQKSTGKT